LILLVWLGLAVPAGAFGVAWRRLHHLAADLPRVPDLEVWEQSVPRTNTIIAADGTILAEIPFHTPDGLSGHRQLVRFAEIPPMLVAAILAAEDQRFFRHSGVDVHAIARAALANYRAGGIVEGASTITQQVARNLLPDEIGNDRSLRRKVREALTARRIERRYDKLRIFEVYASHVFLGANAYGVAAAARNYVSKPLSALTLAECALIAGLIQAPGRANPYLDRAAAQSRRDDVLDRMYRAGAIERTQLLTARAQPIVLRPPPERYGQVAPWYTEWARRHASAQFGGAYARGGLRIETAAAPVLTAAAEALAVRHIDRWAGRHAGRGAAPQAGIVLWDYVTGYVEATVGGRSWSQSRFDRATQACRQPGSAFKPIVYAAALARDAITPGTPLRDAPIAEWDEDLGVHWKPANSGRSFRGVALAQDALAASLNAPAVAVLDAVGAGNVVAFAHRLGIRSPLTAVRPLALGASCVTPLELTTAFAAVARGGRAAHPVFVTRVVRDDLVAVDEASPYDPTLRPSRRLDRLATAPEAAEVMDRTTAYQVSAMLADVVHRGTGTAARSLGRPAAGKTGTTNANTDAWFVGYTGRVVSAVWLGYDDPARSLGPAADGARLALPLWMAVVRAAEAGRPPTPVPGPPPTELIPVLIDRETGLLANPGAGGALELYLRPGTEPTRHAGADPADTADLQRVGTEF
jgi:penicillin-binding protein 1A